MNILNSIGHVINAISGNTVIGKILTYMGALALGYITPIAGLLLTCFTFTTVDLIYGIKVAKRQGQKITSEKGWKGTIKKIFDEFVIISLARLLEFTVLGETGVFVLTGGVTVIIALTELWSILENLNTLDPKGPWRALGKYLRKKGSRYVDIGNKDLNKNTDDKDNIKNVVDE